LFVSQPLLPADGKPLTRAHITVSDKGEFVYRVE
jgi:hypothetical protein